MKRFVLLVALSVAPGVAIACPTAADLEDGIVITTGAKAAPQTHIVRRVSGDLVWHSQSSAIFPDAWSSYSHGGLFSLFTHRASGTGQKVTRYDVALPPMDGVDPGTAFTALTTWGDPDGEKQWSGNLTYEVSENPAISIGDCKYDAIRLSIRGDITYPDKATKLYRRNEIYIPELAFRVGVTAPNNIETVGWFSDVLKDSAMIKQSKTMPVLAEVLNTYGVGE
ncbi:MAG: hypothetical protein ABJF86_08750 [Tateyamaria sp.]|uniref:hypothetical protein n=1 Tax=Tateyamaria sp. TaxID=1929288 RepID=UPI00328B02E0